MKKKETGRRLSLVLTIAISLSSVFTAAVSTFAWFQAEAQANVTAEATETTINTAQPDAIKFFRFNGNGTPGGSGYIGYSASGAAFGNTTNVVDTANNRYSLNSGSSWTTYNTNTWNQAWTEIDIENSTDVGNSFDFARMRPGCYYSFCIYCGLATAKLKLTFGWGGGSNVTGVAKNRYVATVEGSTVTQTNYPLNVLMGVNGYATNLTNSGANAATFINSTFGLGTANDKIVYTNSTSGTTSESYYLLGTAGSGTTLSTNQYIYFTIFMGFSDKSDALMYRGTANSKDYYERGNSAGGYGALDGLKSTLTTVEIA